MAKVSVIMPVYNTGVEYFRECVDSVLAQTFADFELLIVDNGSESYIADCLATYSDARIRLFRLEENQGPAVARNVGLDHATGEFIALIDSDDVSLPQRIEKQVAFLESHPEVGCLGTSARIFSQGSVDDEEPEGALSLPFDEPERLSRQQQNAAPRRRMDIFHRSVKNRSFPSPKKHIEIESFLIFVGSVFCHSSVMLRKSVLDEHGIRYNPDCVPAEDYALWLDLIGKTRFAVLDDVLVNYRFHDDNISRCQRGFQLAKAAVLQYHAFEKYCNLSHESKHLWLKFINGKPLSPQENEKMVEEVTRTMDVLVARNYPREDVFSLFRKSLKKIYYRTHTLRGQWALMCSPVNRLFHLGMTWRLFSLVKRGVF